MKTPHRKCGGATTEFYRKALGRMVPRGTGSHVPRGTSLADAEPAKYLPQQLVGADFAGDAAQ